MPFPQTSSDIIHSSAPTGTLRLMTLFITLNNILFIQHCKVWHHSNVGRAPLDAYPNTEWLFQVRYFKLPEVFL